MMLKAEYPLSKKTTEGFLLNLYTRPISLFIDDDNGWSSRSMTLTDTINLTSEMNTDPSRGLLLPFFGSFFGHCTIDRLCFKVIVSNYADWLPQRKGDGSFGQRFLQLLEVPSTFIAGVQILVLVKTSLVICRSGRCRETSLHHQQRSFRHQVLGVTITVILEHNFHWKMNS